MKVFHCCGQMVRNLVEVLRLLSTAKPRSSGAGLELLLAARGSEDGAAQLPQKQSSQAYVQREADAAWDCVQVSIQQWASNIFCNIPHLHSCWSGRQQECRCLVAPGAVLPGLCAAQGQCCPGLNSGKFPMLGCLSPDMCGWSSAEAILAGIHAVQG